MKAHVYHGTGRHSWQDVPSPGLVDPQDAVVRIDAVTICGTDLHIVRGDVPEVASGRILGHEAVGTVLSVGAGVTGLRPDQRVLVSCISSCGRCRQCRARRYGQCTGGGGWVLGHLIDGTQAEQVRVPFADNSLYVLPETVSDEDALMLADILPTSYEVGVLNGHVTPGATVVVVGAGPIGLAAIELARLFSPACVIAVDPAAQRRDAARRFGADVAVDPDEAAERVSELTESRGADVVIEAVGTPATFELCARLVAATGHLANIGVHGAAATLDLAALWSKDVTITTGLVDTFSTPDLLTMVAAKKLDCGQYVTHRFGLDEMLEAFDVFSRPMDTGALKVALFRT